MKGVNPALYALTAVMAVSFASIAAHFGQISLLDAFEARIYSAEMIMKLADANDERIMRIGFAYTTALIASFIFVGYWLVQTNKQNRQLGVQDLRFSPSSMVWWHFVPFANLVMPYKALKESFLASRRVEDWRLQKVPGYFRLWWATWIIGNLCSNVAARLGARVDINPTISSAQFFSWVNIVSDLLIVVCAICLIKIVLVISSNQISRCRL